MVTELSLRVGERIRQRREELGLNQRQLADLIDSPTVSNQTVSKWEKGAHMPSSRYQTEIAKALDVDISYFVAEPPRKERRTPTPFAGDQPQLDRLERKLDEALAQHGREHQEIGAKIDAILTLLSRPETPEHLAAVAAVLQAQARSLEERREERSQPPAKSTSKARRPASKPDPR